MESSGAGRFDDQGAGMAGTSSASSVSGTISRAERSGVAAGMESNFVPYLPQDDAVVAGLGEQGGGVDASETQEVIDHLNELLKAFLLLPLDEFWLAVVADETFTVYLDSYLSFKGRWFENLATKYYGSDASVVSGDGALSRRTFMTLLRMSSMHDPAAPAGERLFADDHPASVLQRKLLDIPRLMDVCAIFGHDNPELTQRLVSNVFEAQPAHNEELVAYILPMIEHIGTLHQRCYRTVEAMENPRIADKATGVASSVLKELLEVVDYLNDLTVTLSAFVKAYPRAASLLVTSENSLSGQGLVLPVLAAVHDTMLPILTEGIARLSVTTEVKQTHHTFHGGQHKGLRLSARDRLRQISESLVDLCWLLIEYVYLSDTSNPMRKRGSLISNKSKLDGVWKASSLVQTIISLTTGPYDSDDFLSRQLISEFTSFSCTGAMLQRLNEVYGLSLEIANASQSGTLALDEGQIDYLSAVLGGDFKLDTESNDVPLMLPSPVVEVVVGEKAMILQSKISQVKDLFPDLGDGFVAACLEAYDNDHERVVERILNGTLHSDLLALDRSLVTKPSKKTPIVEGKGKGKVDEQIVPTTSKAIFEESSSSLTESGSSSSFVGTSGAAGEDSNGIQRDEESRGHSEARIGRYVRRPLEDATFTDLLDSRNRDHELRAVIRAAAAQIEYDDEYDDSFDELGEYVADVGGNEETENLADEVGRRNGSRDQSPRLRASNRPVVLAPWGSPTTDSTGPQNSSLEHAAHDSESGRQVSGIQGGRSRGQKSSVVVPEVEGQAHDLPLKSNLPAGLGRGIRGGQGRERMRQSFVAEVEGQPQPQPTDRQASSGSGAQGSQWRDQQKSSVVVPEVEGKPLSLSGDQQASSGSGGRGGRGRKKWKEQEPKSQFYLKDGKIYSYKVAGAVGVSSLEEADTIIKQDQVERIHGLGAGGNFPIQQEAGTSERKHESHEENGKSGQFGISGEGRGESGRGRSRSYRGRGVSGRGTYVRKDDDNHNRKDNAMKKHFGGLGG